MSAFECLPLNVYFTGVAALLSLLLTQLGIHKAVPALSISIVVYFSFVALVTFSSTALLCPAFRLLFYGPLDFSFVALSTSLFSMPK